MNILCLFCLFKLGLAGIANSSLHSLQLKNVFGSHDRSNISLISLNTYILEETRESSQIENILGLIRSYHPAILALQGFSETGFQFLREKISKHYGVLCKDFENIDARMNKKEYIPVFYDKSLLQGVQSIGIKTGSLTHTCMAVLNNKFTNKYFSVVNLDLYSANETTTDVQFSKVLKVIMDSDFYKFPIFITGTINAISHNLNRLMHTTFRNIYDLDIGNVGLNKNTFHNHGKINDGVQRDFILLKNQPGYFFDLHSRILSDFPKDNLDHYPVYLSFRNNPANPQIKY